MEKHSCLRGDSNLQRVVFALLMLEPPNTAKNEAGVFLRHSGNHWKIGSFKLCLENAGNELGSREGKFFSFSFHGVIV